MDLSQFAYQGRNKYHSQQDHGGNKENYHSKNSLPVSTLNKAYLTSVPETPKHLLPMSPNSRSTGGSRHKSVNVRKGERRRKRCNQLSSSSEEEVNYMYKENESKEEVTPSRDVAIFSRLPACKRRKRTSEDDKIKVNLSCTEEVSQRSIVQDREEDLNKLCEMFPKHQRIVLEVLLRDNDGNIDQTISSLVGEPLVFQNVISM